MSSGNFSLLYPPSPHQSTLLKMRTFYICLMRQKTVANGFSSCQFFDFFSNRSKINIKLLNALISRIKSSEIIAWAIHTYLIHQK